MSSSTSRNGHLHARVRKRSLTEMEDPWWPETFFFFITEAFWAWPETGKERLSWIERGEEENEMWQIAQSDSYSWFLFDSWLAFHGGYWRNIYSKRTDLPSLPNVLREFLGSRTMRASS